MKIFRFFVQIRVFHSVYSVIPAFQPQVIIEYVNIVWKDYGNEQINKHPVKLSSVGINYPAKKKTKPEINYNIVTMSLQTS